MTPLRVLHRRSPLVRPKTIHSIFVQHLEGNFYIVDLKTESGTYIKEFIHSDFGRTLPSLGSLLGCRADILSLDVTVRHIKKQSGWREAVVIQVSQPLQCCP